MDKKQAANDLDQGQRAKEIQTQGGTDFETTDLDRPSDLERPGGDLIGSDKGEYGPLTVVEAEMDLPGPMDPSGDDPFVPGTAEAKDDFDADSLTSPRDKKAQKAAHSKGADGPSYEAHQGNKQDDHGGSTDPNNTLTESDSGFQQKQPLPRKTGVNPDDPF